MVTERRRERRIKARILIKIRCSDKPPIYTQTENISLLGTYVELKNEGFLGEKLQIAIEIPAYTKNASLTGDVRCRGDVFRCNLVREVETKKIYGLGIFFTDFDSLEDRNKLLKYIDCLIRKEQEDIKQAIPRWREKRRKHPRGKG